tara:strand:- start:1827 stop:2627 length:801 start_codon:yes stop_codon:yes gene_type:complete
MRVGQFVSAKILTQQMPICKPWVPVARHAEAPRRHDPGKLQAVSTLAARMAGYAIGAILLLLICVYAVAFWWPRPPDTTEARVFLESGAHINYCALPELDAAGLAARDIPKAYTPAAPACHYTDFPAPVLAHCREPIAQGFPDLRGLWLATGGPAGHLERIEQCGDRFVITTAGIIHDFHADGTLENGSRDVEGVHNHCANTWASISVDDNAVLRFHPFGISAITIVRRWREGDALYWDYPAFDEPVKMRRICEVPVANRVFEPPQ